MILLPRVFYRRKTTNPCLDLLNYWLIKIIKKRVKKDENIFFLFSKLNQNCIIQTVFLKPGKNFFELTIHPSLKCPLKNLIN